MAEARLEREAGPPTQGSRRSLTKPHSIGGPHLVQVTLQAGSVDGAAFGKPTSGTTRTEASTRSRTACSKIQGNKVEDEEADPEPSGFRDFGRAIAGLQEGSSSYKAEERVLV